MTATMRLLATLLLFPAASLAQAQSTGFPDDAASRFEQTLASRNKARARMVLDQADPQQIAREMRATVPGACASRFRQAMQGYGTVGFYLETVRPRLEAEQVLSRQVADQLAALEWYWKQAWIIEEVNRERWERGEHLRPPGGGGGGGIALGQDGPDYTVQFLNARSARLELESRLRQLQAKVKQSPGLPALPSREASFTDPFTAQRRVHVFGELRPAYFDYPFPVKQLARAKFEASTRTPEDLARERVATIRSEMAAWCDQYSRERWHAAEEFLPALSRRLLMAERALHPNAADQVIFFERHRQQARLGEAFQARRGKDFDKWPTFLRLEADLWLLQVRAKTGQKAPLGCGEPTELACSDPELRRRLIRFQREMISADPRKLAREKAEAAQTETDYWFRVLLSGHLGRADGLFSAARMRLDAEFALAESPEAERVALERHWALMREIEIIQQGRFDSRNLSIDDLKQSRYHRLEAELWLVQASDKGKP
jgi:hypothetical protein